MRRGGRFIGFISGIIYIRMVKRADEAMKGLEIIRDLRGLDGLFDAMIAWYAFRICGFDPRLNFCLRNLFALKPLTPARNQCICHIIIAQKLPKRLIILRINRTEESAKG